VAIICLYKLGHRIICNHRIVSGFSHPFQSGSSLPLQCGADTALPHRRGSGPQPVISKYNLHTSVRPYLARALACNILVSDGSSYATMPLAAGTSSGKETSNPLDDVVQRLDRLKELVRAVMGDLRDVKAQQTRSMFLSFTWNNRCLGRATVRRVCTCRPTARCRLRAIHRWPLLSWVVMDASRTRAGDAGQTTTLSAAVT
jgi:hypothetical protein